MNVVAKMADVSKVSIIGQLYTKRGINYLLRNVLLNPKIKRILLVGADLMGSGEELLLVVSSGVERPSVSVMNIASLDSSARRRFLARNDEEDRTGWTKIFPKRGLRNSLITLRL